MQQKRIFFDDWVILDYLATQDNPQKTTNVELLIGLMLNKFCEKQFSKKCWIGVEVGDQYLAELPDEGLASLSDIDRIITKMVKQNSPVDVCIGIKPESAEKVSRGMDFQIKRFGKEQGYRDTASLVNYINGMKTKYGKTDASLVVIIETPEEIDLLSLQTHIDTEYYPFQKIMMLGLSGDKINFYGIWPESGHSVFNTKTMQFDF